MALSATEVSVMLTLQDQFSGQMRNIQASLDSVNGRMGGLGAAGANAGAGFLKLSGAMAVGHLAATAITGAIGGIAGALGGAMSASTAFGQSMSNVKSALPTADAAKFGGAIEGLALQLGKDLPLSASDAGAGIEALAKKGISAADILDGAGRSVAILASVTGEDLALGAQVAAAAVNTFGLSGKETIGITNLMAGAVLRGGTTVGQFGQGMAQAGTTIKTFGGTVEDVTLALGVMAKAGVQGSDAGTSLKTMYQNLIPTTKEAINEQTKLGLVTADGASQFIDATGKVKSYEEISRILADATKGLSEAQQAQSLVTIFGTDAIRAASIAAAFGSGKFGDLAAAIRSVDAEGAAKERLNNLNGDMVSLAGSVETLQISLLSKLTPAFRGIAQAANEGVGAMIDAVQGMDFSGIVTPIAEAFAAAGKVISDGGSITDAVAALLDRLTAFGQDMFGAGFALISAYAQGMVNAISAVFQAVSAVAEAIASFLVGESPPPEGPLSNIDADGAALIEAYAAGMGAASLGPVEEVTAKVQGILTDFKGLESIGADVEGQIRMIGDALDEVNRASEDLKFQIDDIKQGYEDQITPLKDQLDAIDDVNESLGDQLDLMDRITALNLKQAESTAKGDPAKRAEIAGQLEANKFAQESLQLRQRELQLTDVKSKKPGGASSNEKSIEAVKAELLKLDQQELGLKKQTAALTDKTALAEIAKQKTALDLSGDARKIQAEKAKLERELLKLPIERQIKDLTKAQRDQLKPIEAQLTVLERQEAAIERQRKLWQDLAGDIKRAAEAVKPEPEKAKAAGGGGAGAIKIPGGAGGAPALKIPDLGASISKAADEATAQALIAGEKVATNMTEGIRSWFAANGTKIIGGALGALVGMSVLGPLGALIGAGLGAAIGDGIGQAVPDIGERVLELVSIVQTEVIPALQQFASEVGSTLSSLAERARPGMSALQSTVEGALGIILGLWDKHGAAIMASLARLQAQIGERLAAIQEFWVAHGEQIMAIVNAAWALIAGLVELQLTILAGLFTVGLQLITGDWSAAWATMQQLLTDAWTIITTVIVPNALILLQAILAAAWVAIQATAVAAWTAIQAALLMVWTAITATLGAWLLNVQLVITNAWTAITAALGAWLLNVQLVIANAWGAITLATTNAWNAIAVAVGGVWTGIQGAAEKIFPAIAGIVSGAWDAVDKATGGALKGAAELASRLFESIGTAADGAAKLIDGFVQAIQAIPDSLPGWMTGGSPSPAETWLHGIANAADRAASGFQGLGGSVTALAGADRYISSFGTPDTDNIADYIAQAAALRGMDPNIALRVANSEGGVSQPANRGTFGTGSSWWPYQLHYGGAGYEYLGSTAGMGNSFTAMTGWAPGDPMAWKDSVDYALDAAKRSGWGAWYGAAAAGIGNWEGIGRRLGGPVQAWKDYIVGEDGPEMFRPSRSGEIIPLQRWSDFADASMETTRGGHYQNESAGSAPIDYDRLGAAVARAVGGRGETVNISGAGTEEVLTLIQRRDRRNQLLRPRRTSR